MNQHEAWMFRVSQRSCMFFERWFPDAYAFALAAVLIIAFCAIAIGVAPLNVALSFGEGYWSVIPFTMQMSFIIIGGYVTADAPPVMRIINRIALIPRSARGAIAFIALISILLALVHWGLSLVMSSLLVRAIARRNELVTDYRAAGAAACLGIGSIWALGLSSSAAQLQANPASMPASLLAVSGVIPFTDTIFLWQSMLLAAIVTLAALTISYYSAPDATHAQTANSLGVELEEFDQPLPARERPGEWLEYSPFLTITITGMGITWLLWQLQHDGFATVIANLNNYNFLFLMTGMLLHWRPRYFVASVMRSIPSVAGILIQYPLLGSMASMMTMAKNGEGHSIANFISNGFTAVASHETFALLVSLYSAALGLAIPSGGGKWLVEGPYVMQAANELQYNLGWTLQIYNASEALPNLINPFWMLPVLGILKLKARDLIGYTFVQFILLTPLVVLFLWLLGETLPYVPPEFH